MARGPGGRAIQQRPRAQRRGEGHAGRLGRRRRARRRPGGSAAPPTFADGWQIGTPDLVFEMPEAFEVPAEGEVDYQYFTTPTHLTEDTWVRAIRGPPRSPIRRAPRPGVRPGSEWRSTTRPLSSDSHRRGGDRGGRARARASRDRRPSGDPTRPHRNDGARHQPDGLRARHGASDSRRLGDRLPGALHGDGHGNARPIEGRAGRRGRGAGP